MKFLSLKARSLESLKLKKELTLKAGDSIYFIGICGTAMASLAVYLKQEGFVISGSDQNIYPPMSFVLKKEEIPVFEYRADNIQAGIKLIVVGNVISSSHIEIQKAKVLDIPVLSLPEFLQQSLLSHTKNIVIVGTHGKSTSTALMAHTAEESGQKPGFFIGGFPYNFNSSFRASSLQPDFFKRDFSQSSAVQKDISQEDKLEQGMFQAGESQIDSSQIKSSQVDISKAGFSKRKSFKNKAESYFIIEGDEYDTSFFAKRAKFFYYNPSYVILTGIEFDHGDIYKDLEDIQKSFSKFLSEIPSQGALVACIESQSVKKLLPLCKAPVLTYGIGKGDYQIKSRKIVNNLQTNKSREKINPLKDIIDDNKLTELISKQAFDTGKFDNLKSKEVLNKIQQIEVLGPGQKTYQLLIPLLGWHNALNALGVFILAKHLGWKEDQVLKALKSFKGLKRRLEFRFEYKGTQIFEDFAHHPTAIQAGLSALKESYPQKRLVALFEPRSFTARSDFFQKEYVFSFKPADLIFIAQAYQSHKQEKQLSVKTLFEDLKKEGKKAFYFESFQQLEKEFKKQIKEGDIAVFMSSGAFGSLLENLKQLS